LKVQVARVLGWAETDIGEFRVVRRSLDARKERRLGYRMRVEIARAGESVVPFPSRSQRPSWPVAVKIPRVVIVGSGPAGAWAALRLAEAGVTSIILERGKPVQPRRARPGQPASRTTQPGIQLLFRRRWRGHLFRRKTLHA